MANEFKRMQKLAGLITENEYRKSLDEDVNLLNFIKQNKEEVVNALKTQTSNDHLMDLTDFETDAKGNASAIGIFNVGTEEEPDEFEGGISFLDVTGRGEGKNTIKVGDKIIKFFQYNI